MWKSLGYVSGIAGTPKLITTNALAAGLSSGPTATLLCHAIFIQQVRTNTGYLLVGQDGMNESTGLALNALLPIPTANSLPNATVGIPDSGNPLNAAEYFVDWTVSGDKALISVLIL